MSAQAVSCRLQVLAALQPLGLLGRLCRHQGTGWRWHCKAPSLVPNSTTSCGRPSCCTLATALQHCHIWASFPWAETCGNPSQMLVQHVPMTVASAWAILLVAGACWQQLQLSRTLQKSFHSLPPEKGPLLVGASLPSSLSATNAASVHAGNAARAPAHLCLSVPHHLHSQHQAPAPDVANDVMLLHQGLKALLDLPSDLHITMILEHSRCVGFRLMPFLSLYPTQLNASTKSPLQGWPQHRMRFGDAMLRFSPPDA